MPLDKNEALQQVDRFVQNKCEHKKTTKSISYPSNPGSSIQNGSGTLDKEINTSYEKILGHRIACNLSESCPLFKMEGATARIIDETEGKTSKVGTFSPLNRRRAEDIGESKPLPTVHEGQKLRNSLPLVGRRPRSFSDGHTEQSPHAARSSSPHPSSPLLCRRSRGTSAVAANCSIFQRQAAEKRIYQYRTGKIPNPSSLQGNFQYLDQTESPRLKRRSYSANLLYGSENAQEVRSPQLRRQASQPECYPQGTASSGELGGPFSPNCQRRMHSLKSCSPGLQRRGTFQRTMSCPITVASTVPPPPPSTLGSPPLSPRDKSAHALTPRTPTPVVSPRVLPQLHVGSSRRLGTLSPIKMPLDATRDLFSVSPLTPPGGLDILSPESNESLHAQENISDFFNKMTVKEKS